MGYITVTCHFLTDWKSKSVALETTQIEESHTAENIGGTLVDTTEHYREGVLCNH